MRKIFVAALIAFSFAVITVAHSQEPTGVTLTTRPPGATVYLDGEYDVVANTPARLPANVSGRYKVKITRPGYETWNGDLTFLPGSATDINIDLGKKTRFKAMLRSLIIPGWGQLYSGEKRKGLIITSGALFTGTAFYFLDREYHKRSSDYEIALANYDNAPNIEDKLRLKIISDDMQRKAYDAETDRNTSMAIFAGLWAFNVIDAVIFFPEGEALFPTLTALDGGAAITFTAKF